jgi:succinate dehydrogenase/fumarate reductase cytochrome b subunit
MNQHIRNQLSLMAWVMAGLCGWVMFLAVHSITIACTDCDAAQPAAYSNAHPTAAQK